MPAAEARAPSAGESSATVKPTAPASMKSATTAAAVKAPATSTVPSAMLCKRHLWQPRKRKHRHNTKYNSNQNSLFHITTLGSRSHNP
jgi:hypothetical protein